MKTLLRSLLVLSLLATTALGKAGYHGREEMVKQADLVALVIIQELTSTDKSRVHVDLIAKGTISKVLKGEARDEITFRIPQFYPCAAFDVSTGEHLVFLKKDDKGNYAGFNWQLSYVHLGVQKVTWYGKDGAINAQRSPWEILDEVKALIRDGKLPAGEPKPVSRPYVAVNNNGGFYAKTRPDDEKHSDANGVTRVYRVRDGDDELFDTYNWYAPRRLGVGMLVEWCPTAGKVAVMRLHEEPAPYAQDRVEISFYVGGKLVRSLTAADLAEYGAEVKSKPGETPTQPRLNYQIAGNWVPGPKDQHCWAVYTKQKQLLVDFATGQIVDVKDRPQTGAAVAKPPAEELCDPLEQPK